LKITRELKIGITFIVALALFIWGFNFLKGKDVFKNENHYFVVYKSITGLAKSSPVFLHGLRVGTVKNVSFLETADYPILVDFAISATIKIPKNSVVWIVSSDLLGSKSLDIRLGNSGASAASNDTLSGFIQTSLQEEISNRIGPIKDKAELLLQSMDSALLVIRLVFNESTRRNLESSFVSIKNTLQHLDNISVNVDELMASQKNRLAGIMANVESISANLKNNNQKISNVINNFSNLSDTIAKANIARTFENLNATLSSTSDVMTRINKGEGTVGKLLNNDSLYNALNHSTLQLDRLLEDMRIHPKRYVHFSVFGKKDAKVEPKAPVSK